MAADEGKALRVIAGRGADESLAAGARRDRLAEEVEGAADLVGAHRRQVFALQPDIGAVTRADRCSFSCSGVAGKRLRMAASAPLDILSGHGRSSIPVSPSLSHKWAGEKALIRQLPKLV